MCVCVSCVNAVNWLFGAIICSSQRLVTFLLYVVPSEELQTISDGSVYTFIYKTHRHTLRDNK